VALMIGELIFFVSMVACVVVPALVLEKRGW
jgi:hypothetical protein